MGFSHLGQTTCPSSLTFSASWNTTLPQLGQRSLAADIEANADPRKWICVEAESKIVDYSGDVVILIMTGADSAEAIHAAFTALAE